MKIDIPYVLGDQENGGRLGLLGRLESTIEVANKPVQIAFGAS
jgi:hypothetical protein